MKKITPPPTASAPAFNSNLFRIALYKTLCAFAWSCLVPPAVSAQILDLPAPGTMVHLSPASQPVVLKGIKVHPDNPFQFDFILDRGSMSSPNAPVGDLKEETTKLIKYFLASLTVPHQDMWVNLSPYEQDRIVPESFGQTEMGRDLLAQDYLLKQITATLIYPEHETGKAFWKSIYEEAAREFGTTNVPVNTFNKVWIVPDKAVVYEHTQSRTAYVVESGLKVMLEEDYVSLNKHSVIASSPARNDTHALGSQIVREIILPVLTKEVNEGQNFAPLRQVYSSLILATWYKRKIASSVLGQVYTDKNKIAGINIADPKQKDRIYGQYVQAFKKGACNYIKEEQDPIHRKMVQRKYFSGGFGLTSIDQAMLTTHAVNPEQLKEYGLMRVVANLIVSRRHDWESLNGFQRGRVIRKWASRHQGMSVQGTHRQWAGLFGVSEAVIANIFNENGITTPGQMVVRAAELSELGRDKQYRQKEIKALREWSVQHQRQRVDKTTVELAQKYRLSTYMVKEILDEYKITPADQESKQVRKLRKLAEQYRGKTLPEETYAALGKLAGVRTRRTLDRVLNEYGIQSDLVKIANPGKRKDEMAAFRAWANENRGKNVPFTQLELSEHFKVSQLAIANNIPQYEIITRGDKTKEIAAFRAWAEQYKGQRLRTTKLGLAKQFKLAQGTIRRILREYGIMVSRVPEEPMILLEDSDQVLLLRLKVKLERMKYEVLLARGHKQIESFVEAYPQIKLIVSGGEIQKQAQGERMFLNISDFFNLDETMDEEGENRFLNAIRNLLPHPEKKSNADSAMPTGGIDLNTAMLNVDIQNSGQEIQWNAGPAMLEDLRDAPGFTPVIVQIQPVTNLKSFLEL